MSLISKDQVIQDTRDAYVEVTGDTSSITYGGENGLANKVRNMSGGGTGAQADWNTNSSSSPSYIKNRPFYEATTTGSNLILTPENADYDVINNDTHFYAFDSYYYTINIGDTYNVTINYSDGTSQTYENVPVLNASSVLGIANTKAMVFDQYYNEALIFGVVYSGFESGEPTYSTSDTGISVKVIDFDSIEIEGLHWENNTIVKVPQKYLPETEFIATYTLNNGTYTCDKTFSEIRDLLLNENGELFHTNIKARVNISNTYPIWQIYTLNKYTTDGGGSPYVEFLSVQDVGEGSGEVRIVVNILKHQGSTISLRQAVLY